MKPFFTMFFLLFLASVCSAQTSHYFAELSYTNVRDEISGTLVEAPPIDASAVAEFTLTETGLDAEATLAYRIELFGLDLDGTATADLDDDVTAIHFHNVEGTLPSTANTVHVLNIYGAPRADDADLVVDIANQVVTGLWDDTDATPGVTPAPSQRLSDELGRLREGNLFLMVHTRGGEVLLGNASIGGFILPVPEPATGLLGGVALAILSIRRRRS